MLNIKVMWFVISTPFIFIVNTNAPENDKLYNKLGFQLANINKLATIFERNSIINDGIKKVSFAYEMYATLLAVQLMNYFVRAYTSCHTNTRMLSSVHVVYCRKYNRIQYHKQTLISKIKVLLVFSVAIACAAFAEAKESPTNSIAGLKGLISNLLGPISNLYTSNSQSFT